jgi:hypothetical protein
MTRTVYGIRDTAGVLIAEHVRVERAGGKQMFWQLPGCDPRDGLGGLSAADLPLYGAQWLAGLAVGATVLVCEGERATDALWRWHIPAVGTVTGASGTPGEDALAALLPFDAVTWEDYDEPGRAHMGRVAASMIRLGGGVRRLTWGERKGDDAADFIERGGTRVQLRNLVQAARPWVPEPETPPRPPQAHYGPLRGTDARRDAARSHLVQVVIEKCGPPARQDSRSLWWRCPFHAGDRVPSFKVDLKEPFYRCHACGARGDVFTFLRASEGAGFRDVLSTLAPAPRQLVPVW